MGVPKTFQIDLSVALTDQKFDISGNLFYVWQSPDQTSYVEIKVNNTREPAIQYIAQTGLNTPFERLYITTPAGQTGNMTIIYATEAPELMTLIDNRAVTAANLADILEQLRGDVTPENWGEVTVGVAAVELLAANANRKACWIDSDPDNTGNIYLGFDNTVTTRAGGNNWFKCLTPGMGWGVDDYRGAIYAIATAANQYAGVGEW
ncbi:MAG: hypothetical protein AMJ79_11850 [Phycisphaerae bacterium SM23_30]|nr:MAG: hypothetical protein AMJ79_11850 [Phycisphaerae bacterium SM23_30]